MAGVSNCTKVRFTGRKQWMDQDLSPNLQTVSVNGRVGDSKSALGAIAFKDENGYHSQTGAYFTYAHHIMFSRSELDIDMLSFGLSAGLIQYKLDESTFLAGGFDPLISGIEQSATDFNLDFGFSYQYLDFYAHAAIKNLLNNDGINFNEQGLSYNNLRTYLFTTGYLFSDNSQTWNYEPSIMFAHKDATKETFLDLNLKVYREMDFGRLWAGLSYRNSFDGAEYLDSEDCIIYLVNQKENNLEQIAAFGDKLANTGEIKNKLTIPINNGIVGTVVRTGISEIIRELSYRVNDGIPNLNNEQHLIKLFDVLKEFKWPVDARVE